MIRFLLLAYPPAWRRRYGVELAQLVADGGLSWSAAVDLIAAGLVERGRVVRAALTGGSVMVIGPAWRHPNLMAILALVLIAPTLTFVVGSLVAYDFGHTAFRPMMEDVSYYLQKWRWADLVLVFAPGIALILAVAPLIRVELRPTNAGPEALFGVRLRLANLIVGLLAVAIGALLVWHIVFESVMEVGP